MNPIASAGPYEGRLSLVVQHAREATHMARQLVVILRETDTNIQQLRMQHSAADAITLRGIPAVGRNCTGAIRHTIPGANLQ